MAAPQGYKELTAGIRTKVQEMLQNMELAGPEGTGNQTAAKRARVASRELEALLGPFRKLSNHQSRVLTLTRSGAQTQHNSPNSD